MMIFRVIFWVSLLLVAYAFVGYPLILALLGRVRPRPLRRSAPVPRSASIVIAARNEATNIQRRINELCDAIEAGNIDGELIIVSDGSDDRTADVARAFAGRGVRLVELPAPQGKAVALARGCAAASKDILILADARQTWAADALLRLLENFADPNVGAVSGQLVLESSPGVLAGVGFYWKLEKWLRRRESHTGSQVGVTGAICAVRRGLFRPPPPGTILDDVYWPMCVAMEGYRVVNDPRARAFDRLPARAADEFRRKVRTLCGNFQLLALLPGLLFPRKNPLWFRFLSHKLARLAVPWAMLALFLSSTCLSADRFFLGALALQMLLYSIAMGGIAYARVARSRLPAAAASFLVLNTAAFVAFWVWITGRTDHAWRKAAYQPAGSTPAPSGTTPSSLPGRA